MAGKLPAPVVFIILTAIESVAVLQYLSRYLTDTPLKYVFGSAVAVNLVSYGFYTLYIYPYFVSPLRHLPGPKVLDELMYAVHESLTLCRVAFL